MAVGSLWERNHSHRCQKSAPKLKALSACDFFDRNEGVRILPIDSRQELFSLER